jgi:cytochrome P450
MKNKPLEAITMAMDNVFSISTESSNFVTNVLYKMIIVNDANIARYVLAGNHSKSPSYKTLLPLIGTKSMVATEGEVWAKQGKLYIPGFNPDF